MSENVTLNLLSAGSTGIITKLKNSGVIRRRIQDMGIIPGTEIECTGQSPFGDPRTYFVRGTHIALRNSDSEKITVKIK